MTKDDFPKKQSPKLGSEGKGGFAGKKPGSEEKRPGQAKPGAQKPGVKPAPSPGVADDPELAAKLTALRSRVSRLQDDSRLRDATREFSSIENTINKLPSEVEKIRSRGYAFRSFLENKAKVMAERWQDVRQRTERAIDAEVADMRRDMDEIENLLSQQNVPTLEAAVDSLESKITSAKGRIEDLYGAIRDDANQTKRQIDEINWICDRKDEASFRFLAGESVFLAAKAEWDDGGDKPEGFIFLTDQRIVFEQKEKVGKKLGMFGGKEVHEMKWEVLLPQVEAVEAENKGMFGGKDMLYLTLGGGAPYPKIIIEVKGGVDCKFWQKQIQRMVSGDTTDERAIEADPELVERLREAPTECHVCGGKLPMIVAGQNQIECQYCGSTIRL